jgi:hypothetical protein
MGSKGKAKARYGPRLIGNAFSHKKQASKGLLAGLSNEQIA